MTTSPTQPLPQRPPKKKHWVRRIFIAIVAMLLLIALGVQIVLWTDLPRGIVINQIEKQLALRLTVKSLHTTWLGHTELHDATLALPLADKAFLEVPTMTVKNTSLFGLILGRAVEVEKIELDHPHLYVRQNAGGGWNIQEVAELVARATGKTTGEQSADTSSPMMPDVHLVDGIITIIDNQQRTLDLSPLRVEGYRDTAVSFKYDIQIPPQLSIAGRLVPGGNWAHEIAIKLQDLGAWARPWKPDFPDVVVDANWRGEISDTGVGGRLELQRLSLGAKAGAPGPSATGALTAAFSAGNLTIHPDNLLLQTGAIGLPQLKLASGTLSFNPAAKDVKADKLLVSLFGGAAKVNADYNLNTSAGQLDAGWEKLLLPNGMTHGGALTATLGKPFPDKIILDGHLTSTSQQKDIGWLASLGFHLDGASLTDFNWTVAADKIQGRRHNLGLNLDGLKMTGGLHADTFSLASINLPNKDLLSGTASYHLTGDQTWDAHLIGQRWPFTPVPGTELAFEVKANGNDTAIKIEDIVVKSPDVRIGLAGSYTYKHPKPLDLQLSITNAPPTRQPVALAPNTKAKLANGSIESHMRLQGTVQPLNLDVLGNVNGREIDIRGHHLGDVSLVLSKQSHVDTNGVFVYTDSLSLLGGKWGIDSIFVFDTDLLKVDVDLDQLQLSQAAQFADQQNITGTMDGKLIFLLPGLNPDINKMQILQSAFTIKDLNAAGVMVDQIDATVSLDNGYLQIDPIHLQRTKGAGDVHVGMNLNDFRKIDLSANFSKWPIDVEGVPAHLDASVDIPHAVILLPNPNSGDPRKQKLRVNANQITIHGTTTFESAPLGDIVAHAGITGRAFDLRGLHMTLLGGRLDGQAHADLDKLLSTTAEFTWERLDFEKLARMVPQLREFHGELTGNARLAPATVAHPLEPLAVVIKTTLANGYWQQLPSKKAPLPNKDSRHPLKDAPDSRLPINDARIAAYFGSDEKDPKAGWSIVLDDSNVDRSFIHLADGTIEFWGRFSTHGRDNSSLAQFRFFDLNLNTLAHALEPSSADMPGKMAGSILLIRAPLPETSSAPRVHEQMFPGRPPTPVAPFAGPSPKDPSLKQLIEPIYGEGKLELTQTNLAKFPPFAFLYDTAKLFRNINAPEGHGDVEFHLERGGLEIESLRYFNRGTEIRAIASLGKLWNFPDNPLDGSAFLTARPLGGVKIPFIADLDSTLTAIQNSLQLTGVRFYGTVDEYKPVPLLLSAMGKQMKALLVHDAKSGGN